MSKTLASNLPIVALTSLAFGLTSGCDQSPSGASKPATVSSQPAAATPIAPPTPLAKTYPATLAEGIDFARPGYPDFIVEVNGLSGHERWGRWSDGDKTTFRFKLPLPSKFVLSVTANAYGPNVGKPVKVNAGAIQQEFTIAKPGETVNLSFELPAPTDRLEFLIPQPISPAEFKAGSKDLRKIGIGFIKLQITP